MRSRSVAGRVVAAICSVGLVWTFGLGCEKQSGADEEASASPAGERGANEEAAGTSAGAGAAAAKGEGREKSESGREPSGTVPQLEATSLDGETVSLAKVERPTLVNLWATWCAPCLAEMPLLMEVRDEWSSKGLQMVGISVEKKSATDRIQKFADENDVPFEIWYAPKSDPLSKFGASAVPATYVYGTDGKLVWSHDGRIEEKQLADLQEVVASVVGASEKD